MMKAFRSTISAWLTLLKPPARPTVSAWLALVRAPNLLTVPGDPLAGLVIAAAVTGQCVSAGRAIIVSLISLCFYAAGMILNDIHDLEIDRARRPERPLPSGRISPQTAFTAAVALAVIGLLLALAAGRPAFVVAIFLVLFIISYNILVKEDSLRASICMGLCRGTSMLLGAAALDATAAALAPALCLAAGIGAITSLARHEHETRSFGPIALFPAAALGLGWMAIWFLRVFSASFLALFASLAAGLAVVAGLFFTGLPLLASARNPAEIRHAIGLFLSLLLPWQAALILTSGTPGAWLTAIVLLLLWPTSRFLGQLYSPS